MDLIKNIFLLKVNYKGGNHTDNNGGRNEITFKI